MCSRCRFIQYIPNKPDKFGIKSWLLCEVDSKYICNAIPYLGKDDDRPSNTLLCEHVVFSLIEPYQNKGYCITADNFFTTVKCATSLLAKKTTFIGTMVANRKNIPQRKKLPVLKTNESIFLEDHNGCILQYYQCKPQKNIYLLSSMHDKASISSSQMLSKKKSDIVLTYNKTKVGFFLVSDKVN